MPCASVALKDSSESADGGSEGRALLGRARSWRNSSGEEEEEEVEAGEPRGGAAAAAVGGTAEITDASRVMRSRASMWGRGVGIVVVVGVGRTPPKPRWNGKESGDRPDGMRVEVVTAIEAGSVL